MNLEAYFLDAETVPGDDRFGDVVYKRERLGIKSWDENIKAELLERIPHKHNGHLM